MSLSRMQHSLFNNNHITQLHTTRRRRRRRQRRRRRKATRITRFADCVFFLYRHVSSARAKRVPEPDGTLFGIIIVIIIFIVDGSNRTWCAHFGVCFEGHLRRNDDDDDKKKGGGEGGEIVQTPSSRFIIIARVARPRPRVARERFDGRGNGVTSERADSHESAIARAKDEDVGRTTSVDGVP